MHTGVAGFRFPANIHCGRQQVKTQLHGYYVCEHCASSWPSPNCHRHLGSEPVEESVASLIIIILINRNISLRVNYLRSCHYSIWKKNVLHKTVQIRIIYLCLIISLDLGPKMYVWYQPKDLWLPCNGNWQEANVKPRQSLLGNYAPEDDCWLAQ